MKSLQNPRAALSVLLALLIVLGSVFCVPISVAAAEVSTAASGDFTKVYEVGTAEALTDAVTEINTAESGDFAIKLTADIASSVSFTKSGTVVTIIGNNHTLSSDFDSCIQVWNGAVVNLGDGNSSLTLKGGIDNDCPGIVYVTTKDSVCNMNNKVTLRDHKGNNYCGGGVTVESGTFNMNGGTIDNCGIDGGSVCYGGGVAVINGGIFNMSGGTISNCYVTSDYVDDYDPNRCFTAMGGGVFVTTSSLFNMTGGSIENNTATNMGGGVAIDISYNELQSYGMGNVKSTFKMSSGSISGNKADCGAGVFASGYFYCYARVFGIPTQPNNQSNPSISINGGEISSNEAADMGGGVLLAMLRPSSKTQIYNAVIKDNKADQGAGVENFGYWTQLDIDNCKITGNSSESNGGGVAAFSNSSNGSTTIKNTEISGNTSGERGAGVYYDANSRINISGADVIKGNTFNGKMNNLNILSKAKPVYVIGDLTGSEIGLSDPTLWDDGIEDKDDNAVSTDYLTSGYKTNNNSLIPLDAFFSDHESWYPDFSEVDTNEVRLVRKTFDVNYFINNDDKDDIYADDIYTPYIVNHEVKDGNIIEEFHNIPKLKDPDGYVFKGWYYDRQNDNDEHPIEFNTPYEIKDKYQKGVDIYAHWEKVNKVEKDAEDDKKLPDSMGGKYTEFGLFGVQIRTDNLYETNIGRTERQPAGLRFVTSISEELLKSVDALSDKKVVSESGAEHNVEYGFVTAAESTVNTVVEKFNEEKPGLIDSSKYTLQYKGKDVNGVDTTVKGYNADNFNYVTNIDCTSQEGDYGGNDAIKKDHRNFHDYRIASYVVIYNDDNTGENKKQNIVARAYMRYYDANGLLRTFYNDYGGTNVYGGCSTSYKAAYGKADNETTIG